MGNLLVLSFVIQMVMQALLVIGSSDITVTEKNPRPADIVPDPGWRCVNAALVPNSAGAQTNEQPVTKSAGKLTVAPQDVAF